MNKYFFIVNPVAGSGRTKANFEQVKAKLEEEGIPFSFEYTTGKNHAFELAKKALEDGFENVISVGGDGTAGEVASALVNSGVSMGILPFGTGNDFARSLRLPTEPMAALKVILDGSFHAIDAAEANGIPFLNVAGTGFDVDVIIYTEKFKKKFNGALPYMLGIFQSLLHLKPATFTVTADGESFTQRGLLFDACNGAFFAGGLNVAPLAAYNDGMLDVCILKDISIPSFLMLLPRFAKGKHLDSKHIVYFKAKEVKVESDRECLLNLDGELGSSTPVTFKILPGALNMLLGK